MVLDLGVAKLVGGTIIQSRGNNHQWVSLYRVLHSMDGYSWTAVNGEFKGAATEDIQTKGYFPQAVTACYVRLHPLEFNGAVSMRADVLLASSTSDYGVLLQQHTQSISTMRRAPTNGYDMDPLSTW